MKNNIIKTIFALVIVLVLSTKMMSQTLNTTSGANNLNPNLDKYVGTWTWEGNNKSFAIIFKKENIVLPPISKNVKADIIYGFHKYTEGNIIVENSTNFSNTSHSDKKNTLFGGLSSFNKINILTGNIIHLSKNGIGGGKKTVNFVIEYLDSTHIKLVSLKNPQGVKLTMTGQPAYDWSISLPDNIILTKQ